MRVMMGDDRDCGCGRKLKMLLAVVKFRVVRGECRCVNVSRCWRRERASHLRFMMKDWDVIITASNRKSDRTPMEGKDDGDND